MSEQLERILRGREFKSDKEFRKFMQSIVGTPLDEIEAPEPTPADRAQDLVYDAWEEPNPNRRLELARQALGLWPDCADAYVVLAEGAKSTDEELSTLEQAVAAGERALGPDVFKEDAGHFWGIHSTRPYMRARLALAVHLWRAGRRDDAINHASELLRLNPNDNQGVRCLLVAWLLEAGDNQGAARLLARFEGDPTANMEYARLLLQYRNWGDTAKTRRMFQKALKSNRYVPEYLLQVMPLPAASPGTMTIGGDDEAVAVAEDLGPAWALTPGALAWLKERWLESRP